MNAKVKMDIYRIDKNHIIAQSANYVSMILLHIRFTENNRQQKIKKNMFNLYGQLLSIFIFI